MLVDLINTNYLTILNDNFDKYLIVERSKYNKIIQSIITYVNENSLVISSPESLVVTNDLTNDPLIIYSFKPSIDSKNITNLIYKLNKNDKESEYTQLRTVIENVSYNINYNFRHLCTVRKINKLPNENISIFTPEIKNGISYLPSEIELIEVYKKIYNLEYYCDLEKNLLLENKLFKIVKQRYSKGVFGGFKLNNIDYLGVIKNKLINNLFSKDLVLIGDWAIDYLGGTGNDSYGKSVNLNKISAISNINPVKLLNQMNNLISNITDVKISLKRNNVIVPTDSNIEIYSYYIKNSKNKHILELYKINYELIPYKKIKNINIGSKWVILRFLFIEFWIFRVLYYNNFINKNIYLKKINTLWKNINIAKSSNNDGDLYLGTYIPNNTLIKIKNKKLFQPYYPSIN